MAVLLKTDSTAEVIHPKNGDKFSLPELHGFVQGYFEVVRPRLHGTFNLIGPTGENTILVEVGPGSTLWCNEHGKLEDLPPNWIASLIYAAGDIMRGPVLLCGPEEVD